MPVIITEPNRRIDASQIAEFEAMLKQKLPDDFREFLLQSNGGRAAENSHPAPDPVDEIDVSSFFGILDQQDYGDLRYMRDLMIDRVPDNMLPIADSEGGNMVLLSLRPDTYGQVFYWDHERESNEGEPPTFSNMVKVNRSFKKFVEDLHPPEPETLPKFKVLRVRDHAEIQADLNSKNKKQ